jgi:hypothetical protein
MRYTGLLVEFINNDLRDGSGRMGNHLISVPMEWWIVDGPKDPI